MANIILTGLEVQAQEDLSRVLSDQGHEVTNGWEGALSSADVLFCNGDDPEYPALVRKLGELRPDLPAVVVTRLAETEKWLDADQRRNQPLPDTSKSLALL